MHGCGDGKNDPSERINQTSSSHGGESVLPETPPVAAIGAVAGSSHSEMSLADAAPGSPEAMLLEITNLVAALEAEPSGSAEGPGLSSLSRQRLERVIDLATQVISATHQHSEQEHLFNNAVHFLSDARLEMASAGDAVQAELLIEDAESLFERDAGLFRRSRSGFQSRRAIGTHGGILRSR